MCQYMTHTSQFLTNNINHADVKVFDIGFKICCFSFSNVIFAYLKWCGAKSREVIIIFVSFFNIQEVRGVHQPKTLFKYFLC